MPDPELVIRPSGEMRISNFLPWQTVYSEFVFMNVLWPDFSPKDLDTAIALIQEKAGMTPIYFAYPQGIKDEWATDLIDGRFQVTGTSVIGVNDPDNGTHDLMRYNVGESTDLATILP